MPVLDDIAAQRQRLAERLARVEAERQKLADQIAELDAAERVLSRMAPRAATAPRRGRRARSAPAADAEAAAPAIRRRRARSTSARTAAPGARGRRSGRGGRKARAKPEVTLADATLRAVETLGNEVSAEQIREYLGREFSMQVRPNHLGMALQRHRRAGRLREDDGRWSVAQAQAAETPTAQ